MNSPYRAGRNHGNELARWTIGLNVSYRCRRVEGVLIAVGGRGADAWIDIKASNIVDVPEAATALFRQLTGSHASATTHDVDALSQLRLHLAEAEAELCGKLLSHAAIPADRVLAVGVHDPGIWGGGQSSARSCLGLCDAARLAELTGLNVIDAFASCSLARDGQCGPVTALSEWILLQDPLRERLLLDLGRTIRMSYLPAGRDADAMSRAFAFEVGPGTRLLDEFTQRLSGGRQSFDRGGSLAVQGRRIDALLEHWLGDPLFDRPLPRWHPCGIQPERFLADAIRMAVDEDWSVRDLLCTATHLIAESVRQALRWLPDGARIDQMLLTGGGRHNGMLLREIASRLPNLPMIQVQELGMPDGALAATSIAVLTFCHIEGIPAGSSACGSEADRRILGRLTPGSLQNWQCLLQEMAPATIAERPLRKAV